MITSSNRRVPGWTRVPAAYKDRMPHAVEADGRQTWAWEGGMQMTMGLNAVAGKPREQCPAAPEMYVPMTIAPVWDAQLAAGEAALFHFPMTVPEGTPDN